MQNDLKDTLLRRHFKVEDLNMFVTNFITLALLEAEELGAISKFECSFFIFLPKLKCIFLLL